MIKWGNGGQRGIRTLERLSPLHTFQACAFNHSATCPGRGEIHGPPPPRRHSQVPAAARKSARESPAAAPSMANVDGPLWTIVSCCARYLSLHDRRRENMRKTGIFAGIVALGLAAGPVLAQDA